jgi:hypothetical protein
VIGRLRRWWANVELDRVDAELARWLVDDGSLSLSPLDGPLNEERLRIRERRLRAVERLERAGGRDPHPAFLRAPTTAQRDGWERRHRSVQSP